MLNAGKNHTFTIEFFSELDQRNYQGTFTSKRLSILDQTKISRRKSELCGGMFCVRDDDGNPTGQGIDEWAEVQSRMIAILEVALIQKPEWWNLEEISDEELLGKVFEEVMNFENSFRRRGRSKDQSTDGGGSGQGDSKEQRPSSESSDNAPKMVDRQVQAALDA